MDKEDREVQSDDEQEHEVMPGVYITHFNRKNKGSVDESAELSDATSGLDLTGKSPEDLLNMLHELEDRKRDLEQRKAEQDRKNIARVDNFVDALTGLSLRDQMLQLESMIDLQNTQIKHLVFSQEQMQLFLQSDPDDQDIKEALVENEPILERMNLRLSKMESYLAGVKAKMGGHYADDAKASKPQPPSGGNDPANDSTTGSPDAGMWL
jgi:hypothetical protein